MGPFNSLRRPFKLDLQVPFLALPFVESHKERRESGQTAEFGEAVL